MTVMRLLVLALVAAVSAIDPAPARAAEPIVLASTTSLQDSGLLAQILPFFTAQTGIAVRVVAQGTGQALATAARGDADLVLVHDPDAEAAFMAAGHGQHRTEIAWNDFVLVGPVGDPAPVGAARTVIEAFRAIASAKVPFVSRGDRSGTDAAEKRVWSAAGITPAPSWYREIGGGMGAALNTAHAMDAYTLSDRGTWINYGNKLGMRIVFEGDRALLNLYDVIELTTGTGSPERQASAHRLATWLGSPDGQAAIGGYSVGGQFLFHKAADPKPQ